MMTNMFDSIYNNCDPSPKEISCLCGEAVFKMSNGRPRRVIECCCVDCFQHLEWASVKGGPQGPIIPTLSFWENDLVVEKGEDLLQVVLLREKGHSLRLVSTCCFSTLMIDNPTTMELCSCFSKKRVGFSRMKCRSLLMKPDRLNQEFL